LLLDHRTAGPAGPAVRYAFNSRAGTPDGARACKLNNRPLKRGNLNPTPSTFTEGFGTPVLKEAEALLRAMSN